MKTLSPRSKRACRGLPQRGQAMVEFLIVFPTLLLLVMGAFQFSLIYQAKMTLNYATFMAARQGALKNGNTTAMKDALASGMTPLFMTDSSVTGMVKARVIAEIEAFMPTTTTLGVLNPTSQMVTDFKGQSESGAEIPNDNLMYRSSTKIHNTTLQDANILQIHTEYCTRLIVPIVNKVIYSLYFGLSGTQVLGSEYYGAASTAPTVGKRCADPNDQIQGLSNYISQINAACSNCAGFLTTLPRIPTTIPFLDWNIGGYRIPITSDAAVRMQTPYKP